MAPGKVARLQHKDRIAKAAWSVLKYILHLHARRGGVLAEVIADRGLGWLMTTTIRSAPAATASSMAKSITGRS